MMPAEIDPKILALANSVLDGSASKRAKSVLRALLERGSISTDELTDLGYEHPPRAVGDVKDAGIPIVKTMEVSPRTGRRMAVYGFGSVEAIQARASGGRRQFPKSFRQKLLETYGSRDRFSDAEMDHKVLQIDHRIPYAVAGDADELDVDDYMLLDASSQRAKSWACEHCPNIAPNMRDPDVCRTCYWAYPEDYLHIATDQLRRTAIAWQGDDVAVHDAIAQAAKAKGTTVDDILLRAARRIAAQIASSS